MPKISKTTNPTGLKELHAKTFTVRVLTPPSGPRSFWLERFSEEKITLPRDTEISCVAHAGNAEEFFRLGTIEAPNHSSQMIRELPSDRPLKFRFMFSAPNNPKLLAFADNIRAADESGNMGDSLIDIEPADLGGPTWKLELPPVTPGDDRPVLLVERQLFPTALAAAADVWIGVLVMPEVMRQVCRVVSENLNSLDDQDTWIGGWAAFFESLGVAIPVEDADETAKTTWVEDVVVAFCAKTAMRTHMKRAEQELSGEKP
jgi:hypothetical protein